jgi:hypothetical protein
VVLPAPTPFARPSRRLAAALGGDWTAWLSDADANVRDRVIDAECRLLDRPAKLRTIEVSEEQIKNAV